MRDRLDVLGAVVAHLIFVSSILVFIGRIFIGVGPGHWIGIPLLAMAFPLAYLMVKTRGRDRPLLYYVQVTLMLTWIVALFIIDYLIRVDWRETPWTVVTMVMFYFAATGGMIGVASRAGRSWAISAVILFFIAGALAFVQRAVTGV